MEKCCEKNIFSQMCDYIGEEGVFVGHGRAYIWSDGEKILCTHAEDAEKIADVLNMLGYVAVTGVYDLDEDNRDGVKDRYTGMFYVSID